MMKNREVIGIDVGGTYIKYGFVTRTGKIVRYKSIETEKSSSKALIRQLSDLITGNHTQSYIGIGVAGFVDLKGKVLTPPHLPLEDIKLKKILEKRTGRSILLDNDCNCAAIGEMYFGAGKNFKNFVYLGIGTGVGSGLVINGELYRGSRGIAGEVGHMAMGNGKQKCNCKNRGCLEISASSRAIEEKARKLYNRTLNTEEIFELSKHGDRKAQEIINETTENLALGINNIISILNPEAVIIGGGIARQGESLLNNLKKSLKKMYITPELDSTEILTSPYMGRIGIVGAASLVIEKK